MNDRRKAGSHAVAQPDMISVPASLDRDLLEALEDLLSNGATLKVTEGSPEGDILLTAPLAPTVTVDPWDDQRLVLRPLVTWPQLLGDDVSGFSLQDCRLRGIPANGKMIEGGYFAVNAFDEHVLIQPATETELQVISLWEDFLNTLPDDERTFIESHEEIA